jgi:hypothetical protein
VKLALLLLMVGSFAAAQGLGSLTAAVPVASTTPAFVQGTAVCNVGQPGATLAFTSPVSSGNMLLFAIKISTGGATNPTVSDTLSNTWSLVGTIKTGNNTNQLWIYKAMASSSGSDTVSFTFTTYSNTCTSVGEYHNLTGTAGTLANSQEGPSSVNPLNASLVLSTVPSMVVACYGTLQPTITFTNPSGFTTQGMANNATSIICAYNYISSAATYTIGFTVSGANSNANNSEILVAPFQ